MVLFYVEILILFYVFKTIFSWKNFVICIYVLVHINNYLQVYLHIKPQPFFLYTRYLYRSISIYRLYATSKRFNIDCLKNENFFHKSFSHKRKSFLIKSSHHICCTITIFKFHLHTLHTLMDICRYKLYIFSSYRIPIYDYFFSILWVIKIAPPVTDAYSIK